MEGNRQARRLTELLLRARDDERAAQMRQCVLVADLVDAYANVEACLAPGASRLVPSGAEGTPEVADFIAAELAPLLEQSIPTTWRLIHDVVNLRSRHPLLWQEVLALRVPVWQARKVAAECSLLGLEAALWVDDRMRPVWGHLAWGRIKRRLAGLVVDADHALANARAEEQRRQRFVRITHDGDGSSTVLARMDTADALALSDAIDTLARHLAVEGRPEPLPALRSVALGELARPHDGQAPGTGLPRPGATLVVHVARETLDDADAGVARCDTVGPLLREQLVAVLQHRHVSLLPVVDLAGDPGVDCYEIPPHLERHVRARDAFSAFPFSASRGTDLDHTAAFRHRPPPPPRQTRASNLAPLSRSEHRAKTFAGWRATQPAPGIVEWTSPLGYHHRTRNGLTTRISADELLPHDPTGIVHFYPPPDGAAASSHPLD